MPVKIIHDNYGKSRVRLMKVERTGEGHSLQNITVNIAFEGDFEAIHTAGDNSLCLPTDTMKNTVYALAGQTKKIEEIEDFGQRLADHFLANNPQVERAVIDIFEHGWKRLKFDGELHSHAFVKGSGEKRTAKISATRDRVTIESGVEDMIVLKTTGSASTGYIKDEFTTLPEATDRIFSTAIKATWLYKNASAATGPVWREIRQTLLEILADHDRLSVQHTI